MRINIPMVRNNLPSDKDTFSKLKPGNKIRAKVLEVKGDLVRLELRGGEVIYGKSEIPLDFSNEKFMNFIIKDIGENLLSLVPDYENMELGDNYTIKNEKLIMNKVLEFLGLEKTDENMELVKNMVKFKMPLDSETVGKNLRYMEKIISLLNASPDEEIYALNKGVDHESEDIAKFIKLPKGEVANRKIDVAKGIEELEFEEINYGKEKLSAQTAESGQSKVEIPRETGGEQTEKSAEGLLNKEIGKGDAAKGGAEGKAESGDLDKLKNIIETLDRDIKEEIQGAPKQDLKDEFKLDRSGYKEITSEVKSELEKLYTDGKLTESDIQKIVFLNRSGVKISLNSLKNLESILNGENIADDLEKIVDTALKEKLISPEDKTAIREAAEKIVLELDGKDGEKIRDYNRDVNELIKEVSEKISEAVGKSEELSKGITQLNEKLDMYNKINDKSLFMFVPLSMEKEEIKDKLYFMSKRRHGENSETIRAYISLDTENLSRVSALCDYSYGRLDVSFKVGSDKHDIFLKSEFRLKEALSKVGYPDVHISVREDIDSEILDMMSDESGINYMINVKV